MDSVFSEMDLCEISQENKTVDASIDNPETFLSVESQLDSTNDVGTSLVEIAGDQTECANQINSVLEEDSTNFGITLETEENQTECANQMSSVLEEDSTNFGITLEIEEDQTEYASQMNSALEEDSTNFGTTLEVDVSASIEPTVIASEGDSQIEIKENEITIEDDQNYVDESSYFSCKLFELGRYLWTTDSNRQCYTKGCIWSPDGTCCLVPVHLDGMHLVELPTDLYEGKVSSKRPLSKLTTAVHIKEGGTVYDCAWYPFMNSTDPETCCWLASRQHEPIHMWDAFNGDLRATYRGYDDVDEIEAAISVSFTCDGLRVIGGYKKCIRLFNTDIPGRSSIKIPTKQAIASFAFTPHNANIITSGSWNGVINLYDQRTPYIGNLSALFGHTGGITLLKYSNSGELLLSGARKDDNICLWDMRNFSQPLTVLNRNVSTNQRIFFDLSPQNDWLISGDTTGLINIWNLRNLEEKQSFRVHDDSCNGVSFHPSKPIIATSSGQYHFVNPEEDTNAGEVVVDYENSLVFWWIEPRVCEEDTSQGVENSQIN